LETIFNLCRCHSWTETSMRKNMSIIMVPVSDVSSQLDED
jgi:hypothetical protein